MFATPRPQTRSPAPSVVSVPLVLFNYMENYYNLGNGNSASLKKDSPVRLTTEHIPTVQGMITQLFNSKNYPREMLVFMTTYIKSAEVNGSQPTFCRRGATGCCGHYNTHRDYNVYDTFDDQGNNYVYCNLCYKMSETVKRVMETSNSDQEKKMIHESLCYFNNYRNGKFSLFGETTLNADKTITFTGQFGVPVVYSYTTEENLTVYEQQTEVKIVVIEGLSSYNVAPIIAPRPVTVVCAQPTIVRNQYHTQKCSYGINCRFGKGKCRYSHDE